MRRRETQLGGLPYGRRCASQLCLDLVSLVTVERRVSGVSKSVLYSMHCTITHSSHARWLNANVSQLCAAPSHGRRGGCSGTARSRSSLLSLVLSIISAINVPAPQNQTPSVRSATSPWRFQGRRFGEKSQVRSQKGHDRDWVRPMLQPSVGW